MNRAIGGGRLVAITCSLCRCNRLDLLMNLANQAAAALDVAPAPGLADEEWEALRDRADSLLANGVFPLPSERWHRIPWPPI